MPPRARSPRSAPATRVADTALVDAVLAVIDRIGELVQALETGEAIASEDDEPLIAALVGQRRSSPAAAGRRRRRRARSPQVDPLDPPARSTCSTG